MDQYPICVTNTCAVDSLTQVLIVAIWSKSNIKEIVLNETENRFFEYVGRIVDQQKVDEKTYLERFKLLRLARSVRYQINYNRDSEQLEHSFWSNCAGNLSHLMEGYPAYESKIQECPKCGEGEEIRVGKSLSIQSKLLRNGTFKNFIAENYLIDTYCSNGFCHGKRKHELKTGKFTRHQYVC